MPSPQLRTLLFPAAIGLLALSASAQVSAVLDKEGVPHCLSTAGNLFTVFLGRTEPVRNFADAKAQSTDAYAAFFHAMLDGGVALAPGAYEIMFVSLAHSEADLERCVTVARHAAEVAKRS